MALKDFLARIDSMNQTELRRYISNSVELLTDDNDESAKQVLQILRKHRCIIDCECEETPCEHMEDDLDKPLLPIYEQAMILTALEPQEYAEPPLKSEFTRLRIATDSSFAAEIRKEMTERNPRGRVSVFAARFVRGDQLRWPGLDDMQPAEPLGYDDRDDRIEAQGERLINGTDAPELKLKLHGQREVGNPLAWLDDDPRTQWLRKLSCQRDNRQCG